MTIHLSILLFWPLAFGLLGTLAPRGASAVTTVVSAISHRFRPSTPSL